MIELKDIKKSYKVGENKVEALRGVSLSFRKHEFVSILGQSGCGKTTFLNVLGGLDNYDSGDLVVNGTSTKHYRDSNWDAYRSKFVGFVFQSYNLIMHLNVLENVELSLSIAGLSKHQRREKALKALESVGLADQVYKKPNQLSGGQMQRVAIARAIVGEPQIILADEPTGALDTQTSRQILGILKELSKTKLVVMVTHNRDLAEQYSSRIVKMQDGLIVDDSKPYQPKKQTPVANENKKKEKKPSMSFFTALSLSFRNLLTKKTRTFLTAFAGSIGIIGIALVLALSSGFQAYVNKTQSDTMSSYPITLQQTSVNLLATLDLLNKNTPSNTSNPNEIGVNTLLEEFLKTSSTNVHKNDLATFKQYLEQNIDQNQINGIQYTYDVNLNVYSNDYVSQISRLNPISMSSKALALPQLVAMFNQLELWQELLNNQAVLDSQYQLLGNSRWPNNEKEIVIMLNENGQIDDFVLYSLGLRDLAEIDAYLDYMIDPVQNPKPEFEHETSYEIDDFLNLQYKLLLEADYFDFNASTNQYTDIRTIEQTNPELFQNYMSGKLQNALSLEVVGVVKPKENTQMSGSIGAVGYTQGLINYIIENNNQKEVVTKQIAIPNINVFTNAAFAQGESYAQNLNKLGVADKNNPKEIRIYPSSFDSKDYVISFIDEYNETKLTKTEQIEFTDFVGILISSVSTIISAITYVLIAFVSISLLVSSIMIGIITYVSVLERTKEIGILRSVGARKRDVSNVFNAETLLIGFASGFFGIAVTYLVSIPANIILENIIHIKNVVSLPVVPALILILISMALTLFSGLVPARIAAKKDPVKALREE